MTFEAWWKEEGEFQAGQWRNSKVLMEMAWQESRKQALEEAAVAAWSKGMDEHSKALGFRCDARNVGAACAASIRTL
jgi:hypothetical protein